MSNKLKIYVCSGIGKTENRVKTWISEDTNAATNTQAMNAILSIINSLAVDLRYPDNLTHEEQVETYNALDLYSVCFYYSRLYRDATETLANVGNCISKYIYDGGFQFNSVSAEEHDNKLDGYIEDIDAMLSSGDVTEQGSDFSEWWKSVVVGGNVVGLQQDGKIGATVKEDYGDLNKYLYDGGTYFLYLYVPADKLASLSYRIRRKIKKQQEVYNYCKKNFCAEYGGIYGSEETMQRVIRSGIKEDFKGKTPEQIISDLLPNNGIGQLSPMVIAAIISAVTTLVITMLGLIINYAQAVAVAKYAVPDDPESGCPDAEDMENFGSGSKTWLWLVAAGAAILVLFKKKNS